MKKTKIIFWVSTTIIFLAEGVMPALTSHTQMAQEGITSLGYPIYFGTMLTFFKVLGSITLMVPSIPRRFKEWAYAGFGIDFIGAFVSLFVIHGLTGMLILPIVAFGILTVSYISFNKLNK